MSMSFIIVFANLLLQKARNTYIIQHLKENERECKKDGSRWMSEEMTPQRLEQKRRVVSRNINLSTLNAGADILWHYANYFQARTVGGNGAAMYLSHLVTLKEAKPMWQNQRNIVANNKHTWYKVLKRIVHCHK